MGIVPLYIMILFHICRGLIIIYFTRLYTKQSAKKKTNIKLSKVKRLVEC